MYNATTYYLILRRQSLIFILFPYTTLFRSVVFYILCMNRVIHLTNLIVKVRVSLEMLWVNIIHMVILLYMMQWYVWLNQDRKSTRLNSSHVSISYAVFCLKKKKGNITTKIE